MTEGDCTPLPEIRLDEELIPVIQCSVTEPIGPAAEIS